MHHDYQANIQQCYKPSKKKVQQLNHLSMAKDITGLKRMDDLVWFLLKTLSPTLSSRVPTWATYNSLIGNLCPLTCAALLQLSPTEDQLSGKTCTLLLKRQKSQDSACEVMGKQSFRLICRYISKQYVCNKYLIFATILSFEWKSYTWFFVCSKYLGTSLMAVDWTSHSSKQVRSTELGFVIYDINWSTVPMSKFPLKIIQYPLFQQIVTLNFTRTLYLESFNT